MIDLNSPHDPISRVDYQLTVVRSQQSVDERAMADYRWAQGSGETTSRHALPNIRVEVVRDACRQMTHFFSDLIIGRRHSETRTERVPYSHSEWVTVPFEGHVDYRPRGAAIASATGPFAASPNITSFGKDPILRASRAVISASL